MILFQTPYQLPQSGTPFGRTHDSEGGTRLQGDSQGFATVGLSGCQLFASNRRICDTAKEKAASRRSLWNSIWVFDYALKQLLSSFTELLALAFEIPVSDRCSAPPAIPSQVRRIAGDPE